MLAAYGEFGDTGCVSGQEPASIEPYTSSVDTCTNRATWWRQAASRRVWVPRTLVRTKSARSGDGAVDVGLRGEVHHDIGAGQDVVNAGRVADVAFDERQPGVAGNWVEIGANASVSELVEHGNGARHGGGGDAALQQHSDVVGADEARPTRHDVMHRSSLA